MPDLHTIEQATGAKLEAGRALERILDNTSEDYARLTCHNWLIEKDKRYKAALAEVYALIMRLVGERKAWHTRFCILQTAASGAGDRKCQHDCITGGVCDGCGAHIKTVRLDDVGLVSDILDYARLEADLAAMTAERDKYHDTLLSKHGGEPLALLDELDDARRDIAAAREELRIERQTDRATVDALVDAREEARKWEWCLDAALDEREIESDYRTDSEMKADLLARYQPAPDPAEVEE